MRYRLNLDKKTFNLLSSGNENEIYKLVRLVVVEETRN